MAGYKFTNDWTFEFWFKWDEDPGAPILSIIGGGTFPIFYTPCSSPGKKTKVEVIAI